MAAAVASATETRRTNHFPALVGEQVEVERAADDGSLIRDGKAAWRAPCPAAAAAAAAAAVKSEVRRGEV